jgi:thiamine pyrophosphokinase
LNTAAIANLPSDAFIIAADSGLDHAIAAHLRPDVVVGDLDSVTDDGLRWARANGVPIEQYSPDKDATDTELALARALAIAAEHVLLLGGGGDRLDHSIGALTALGDASLAVCTSVSARWGTATVHVLHGPRTIALQVRPGDTFSLLALHGPCDGVSVSGAQWQLNDATLRPASSLGVSNLTVAADLRIEVRTGVLTVIFPNHFEGSTP